MGLLDNLLSAFLKATDPRPRYTESRCLLYKNSVGEAQLRLDAADLLDQAAPLGKEPEELPVDPVHLLAQGEDALVHGLF